MKLFLIKIILKMLNFVLAYFFNLIFIKLVVTIIFNLLLIIIKIIMIRFILIKLNKRKKFYNIFEHIVF